MTETEAVSFQPNAIFSGDCKDVLHHFPEASVDLIYLDPPFFSNKHYEVIWDDDYEIRAFEDRWKGGIENYTAWMMERLTECYRVLKETGTMFVHCDYRANSYLRVELDKLFGKNNYRGEIIWNYGHLATLSGKDFPKKHDTILLYSKSPKFTYHPHIIASKKDITKNYPLIDEQGRNYRWVTLKDKDGKKYKKKRIASRINAGGVPISDVWDIPVINPMANERLGYPTQKPEKLLELVIETSSNPTDLVLDPFCGCGTAVVVAQKMGRRWIGVDVSPTACKLIGKRMRAITRHEVNLVGLPRTVEQLKVLQPFEFQNWVNEKLYARPSPRKSGDMGIDGFYLDGTPIQVKQQDDVGRNVIDNFETAIKRDGKTKGVIVAFSFGKGAYEEVARVKNEEGVEILLKTVDDILNET